jgi:transcriptional regulator GlxA family with amidase domain
VVADGPVVTARGAGVALEFGLELVGRMFGAESAGEIAAAVMK